MVHIKKKKMEERGVHRSLLFCVSLTTSNLYFYPQHGDGGGEVLGGRVSMDPTEWRTIIRIV